MFVAATSQGLVCCNDYYREEDIETGERSRRKKREKSSCTLNENANPKHGVD